MRWELLDGGELELIEDFIEPAEQAACFAQLRAIVPWQFRSIRSFGRMLQEPRQTAWIGDPGAVYTYSGRINEPTPWPTSLAELRTRVATQVGADFNAVLCNLYEHGQHSMGLHADAEPELGPNPVIASVSLGATRRFQLRHRKLAHEKLDVDLPTGSLLVMRGTVQTHYRHGVPKQPRVQEPRINLTFRRIVAG
ncbi:MAG: alpha-ketoglutarate-dependent dioxygenase AlkB [Polyangiales bacterium]